MANAEKVNSLLIKHLSQVDDLQPQNIGWKIGKSNVAGNCVIATRDYNGGDIIFVDFPIVTGPRSLKCNVPICVTCYSTENLSVCSKGCSLPICSQKCENSNQHAFECELFRMHVTDKNKTEWNLELLRVLAPLRCLQMDRLSKCIVKYLHKIRESSKSFEVDLLKKFVTINPADEAFIKDCSRAIDANAYEVETNSASVRGLYPLASFMNNSCVRNTRHIFGRECRMIVVAAKPIQKGEEITSAYTQLLLGTVPRRSYLSVSKEFLCQCQRCADPTEFQTYLSALKCRKCSSSMLPISPLDLRSKWLCKNCKSTIEADKIAILQNAIAHEIVRLDARSPEDIIKFINTNRLLADSNHIIVQFKFLLLKLLGYADHHKWNQLSDTMLIYKKDLCSELLEIVNKLSLGECEIKAVCLAEFFLSLKEIQRRQHDKDVFQENEAAFKESILKDLKELYKYHKQVPDELKIYF